MYAVKDIKSQCQRRLFANHQKLKNKSGEHFKDSISIYNYVNNIVLSQKKLAMSTFDFFGETFSVPHSVNK